MLEGIIGKKIGMTQTFGDNGNVFPVTIITASCHYYNSWSLYNHPEKNDGEGWICSRSSWLP